RDIPISGGAYSGFSVDTPPLVLPLDSLLRFRIGPTGWGVGADQAAMLDLGSQYGWLFPHDSKAYYLQATLELPPQKDDRSGDAIVWHGKLHLPRVRIPIEPDPIDPKTIGPRIDELGPKLLDPNSEVSDAAIDELSLIDDPRVIPWYIKAVKSDTYSLRFRAIDRLARMEGDEALAGLKIGMTTRGSDMGHCATEQVAADIAGNIRLLAAQSLERSPHPQAKSLLWTMEKDPSKSVRLTVVQAAARVDTPETLAIVQRGTQDTDKMVRDEATRLMNDRRNSK
ncbi:MAG: HEAT repeat domain-containing protein, partial [Prosthecobacter sp.]|nr:HEAT repeat domain-containing protein [Prosthecobacter sp.]